MIISPYLPISPPYLPISPHISPHLPTSPHISLQLKARRLSAAHGALPHRAPSTRCTADPVHRVWHRC